MEDTLPEHRAEPAVTYLRQAIALLQGLPIDAPLVRKQANVLLRLVKPRRVEVVKGHPEEKPAWLQLAMDLEADEVNVNIRLQKGVWLAAGVNHVHR